MNQQRPNQTQYQICKATPVKKRKSFPSDGRETLQEVRGECERCVICSRNLMIHSKWSYQRLGVCAPLFLGAAYLKEMDCRETVVQRWGSCRWGSLAARSSLLSFVGKSLSLFVFTWKLIEIITFFSARIYCASFHLDMDCMVRSAHVGSHVAV